MSRSKPYHINTQIHKDDKDLLKQILKKSEFRYCADLVRSLLSGFALVNGLRALKKPTPDRPYCPHGHLMNKENTVRYKDKKGNSFRRCKKCSKIYTKRWRDGKQTRKPDLLQTA